MQGNGTAAGRYVLTAWVPKPIMHPCGVPDPVEHASEGGRVDVMDMCASAW